jgi:predicted dehydrogenase
MSKPMVKVSVIGAGWFACGQLSHSLALMLWLTGLEAVSVAARLTPDSINLCGAAIVEFGGGAIGGCTGAASLAGRLTRWWISRSAAARTCPRAASGPGPSS